MAKRTQNFELTQKGLKALKTHGLTDREIEIALHLLDTENLEQVSKRLKIVVNTVEWHNRNIYRKLKVSTKYGLLMNMFKYVRCKE